MLTRNWTPRDADLNLVKLLLEFGADEGVALHYALEACQFQTCPSPIVCHLLRRGVDPNTELDGQRPLHRLAESSNVGLFLVLLDHGARVEALDARGRNALETLEDKEWCGCPKPRAAAIRSLLESAVTDKTRRTSASLTGGR